MTNERRQTENDAIEIDCDYRKIRALPQNG